MTKDPREYETVTRQWIAVQRAGLHVDATLQKALKKVFIDIRKTIAADAAQAEMIAASMAVLADAKPSVYATLIKQLSIMASIVAKGAHAEAKAVGYKGKVPKMSGTKVRSWMSSSPMASSNTTVKDLYVATMDSAKRQVRSAVLTSKALDEGPSLLKKRISDIESATMKSMSMVSTSAVNQTANNSKQQVYGNAKRLADRVIWLSTLDHRTSPFCQAADGKVFPINKGPRPPAHPNCRSTILLVGKGEDANKLMQEMMPRPAVEAYSKDALDKKGLTTRTGRVRTPSYDSKRSPLKPTSTRKTSYGAWMKSQPKYYQEKVLGKRAAARLRDGESIGAILKDTRHSINFDSLGEALNS